MQTKSSLTEEDIGEFDEYTCEYCSPYLKSPRLRSLKTEEEITKETLETTKNTKEDKVSNLLMALQADDEDEDYEEKIFCEVKRVAHLGTIQAINLPTTYPWMNDALPGILGKETEYGKSKLPGFLELEQAEPEIEEETEQEEKENEELQSEEVSEDKSKEQAKEDENIGEELEDATVLDDEIYIPEDLTEDGPVELETIEEPEYVPTGMDYPVLLPNDKLGVDQEIRDTLTGHQPKIFQTFDLHELLRQIQIDDIKEEYAVLKEFLSHLYTEAYYYQLLQYKKDGKLPEDKKLATQIIARSPLFEVKPVEMGDTKQYILVRRTATKGKLKGQNQVIPLEQLALPEAYIERLATMAHSSVMGLHQNAAKVYFDLSRHFFHPQMLSIVRRVCNECIPCNHSKATRYFKSPYHHDYDSYTLFIDHLGPLTTCNGYKYVLVCVSNTHRFVWLIPTKSTGAKEAALAIINGVIFQGFTPKNILSDNASGFRNALLKAITESLGIRLYHSSAYVSTSNGLAERNVGVVSRTLRKYRFMEKQQFSWTTLLPAIAYSINTSIHGTTGLSPYMMRYGIQPKSLLQSALEAPTIKLPNPEITQEFRQVYQCINLYKKYAEANDQIGIERNKEAYNKKFKKNIKAVITEGMIVYMYMPYIDKDTTVKRFKKNFSGPYMVVGLPTDHHAILVCLQTGLRLRVAPSITRLSRCTLTPDHQLKYELICMNDGEFKDRDLFSLKKYPPLPYDVVEQYVKQKDLIPLQPDETPEPTKEKQTSADDLVPINTPLPQVQYSRKKQQEKDAQEKEKDQPEIIIDKEIFAIRKGKTRTGQQIIYLSKPIGTVIRHQKEYIKFLLPGKPEEMAMLFLYEELSDKAKELYDKAPDTVRIPKKIRKLRDTQVINPEILQGSENLNSHLKAQDKPLETTIQPHIEKSENNDLTKLFDRPQQATEKIGITEKKQND